MKQTNPDKAISLPRKLGILACWGACAGAWIVVFTQLVGGSAWVIDQAATIAPQLLLLLVLFLPLTLILRRWFAGAILALALLSGSLLFIPGRAAGAGGGPPEQTITILTLNALGTNPTPQQVVDLIAESDADVVTLVECSDHLWDLIQHDEQISKSLPFGSGPAHPNEWSNVKLSRWPLKPISLEKDDQWETMKWNYIFRRSHIVEHPEGEFILSTFVVRSPRSPAWWNEGNEQLKENCTVIREYLKPMGLPIIIGADLNATPSSSRTRILRKQTDLRRSKPLFAPGTWPSSYAPWLRVAIDDVLVSSHLHVVSWRTIERETGSDHAPVLVELRLSGSRKAHSGAHSSDQ